MTININKVGVVGCGTMGAGIALVCAQSGYQVVVSEISDELLKKGLATIGSSLARSVEKGKISSENRDAILARLGGTTDMGDFSDCDLVIEAVVENMDLKKKVFTKLDRVCSKQTILCTNTSVLPVIDIAAATARKDKVLGLHFFNPVQVMKLLEIIPTIATSDETIEISKKFGESLGKVCVVARDAPGFIVNRLGAPFMLNAVRMLESGAASKEDIDNAVVMGLNHPMGPLKLLDLIGIDSVYFGAAAIYEETKDHQYAPPVLMKRMIEAGWLGRKTGKGFYEYNK